MTFLSGWRLVLLLAPVALLAAYLLAQRARQRYVVRFTDVDLLASVAPRRSGWQRHVAAAALLAAVVALVVGFARPATVSRTPRERATVMLALDTSASMAADDVTPTRLDAAKAQARMFVAKLPKGLKVGLVSFATSASVGVAPTTDRTTVLAGIDALTEGQGTATGDAITLALQAIKTLPPDASGKPAPAAIVLMSDGTPTVTSTGGDPAQAAYDAAGSAKAARVPIDTIAFGTAEGTINLRGQQIPVPSDPQTMAQIASDSGGRSFTATSASQLRAVYDSIGRAVGYDVHKHDVSEWFTFLGLALAVAAAAAALVWTQRLV